MLPEKGIRSCNLECLFLCLICFSCLFFTSSSSFADSACNSVYIDETTTIRYIHDGDTLDLRDGRKISAEPFANAAKNALKHLFKNDKGIALRYGEEKNDRYGRFLAHGFLTDGQNIQAILLNQGLASAINVPPNTQFSACYLEQEHKARCKKIGLWSSATGTRRPPTEGWNYGILQAKNLKKKHTGFHLVEGIVTKIHSNKKGIWLTIDHKLTIGIRSDDQFLFDLKAIKNMINQSITVRGWINKSKQFTPFYVRVRHPLSIQLSETSSCND